ncbi:MULTISPECIES: alpha/beta fold hydrolase [unclassified Arcicella]|uniref:YheT family hydrolase n=1 Tax=unclassified Arcicella TaxID=2644986 RepID=UPI0028581151|nr:MULTISPECIES: alpha/beta fold hydrolase [unclassified Arcicella]MDR6560196.1 putative alpha/beta-fold hydrolase [Arcicella sp. BE51]MDR6810197.1 putative alpha/beta-fold hydrolase [Arcicella sp. BE140]MDR6821547.1 putative alpha/beta-fold hydrolase [Arcicella sp. BE139]
MPIIKHADYQAPFWLPNGHSQTIFPSVFRKIKTVNYLRERIITPDNDFLDLDWAKAHLKNATTDKASKKLVVLSHGLEGDSSRQYITGMVQIFTQNGFDCLAWNFRSCSGELNKTTRLYHSGATDDLDLVIKCAIQKGYEEVYLIGFSLGGNLTLKYLGEQSEKLSSKIKKAVTFSVPLHLSSSSQTIGWLYTKRFNDSLKKKILEKAKLFPDQIQTSNISKIKTLKDFDDCYTSQLHGFQDAEDYYERNSSLYFLDKIQIPTLIINAQNDPFLSKACFPFEKANSLEQVFFQAPKDGGHCGFYQDNYQGTLWSEKRALEWISNN